MEYIWECPSCHSTTKLNYDATETDYIRIRECICGDHLTWKENQHVETNN